MILLHGNIGEVPKNPQTGNRFSSQAQEGTGKI
jgi:hypothetical protein